MEKVEAFGSPLSSCRDVYFHILVSDISPLQWEGMKKQLFSCTTIWITLNVYFRRISWLTCFDFNHYFLPSFSFFSLLPIACHPTQFFAVSLVEAPPLPFSTFATVCWACPSVGLVFGEQLCSSEECTDDRVLWRFLIVSPRGLAWRSQVISDRDWTHSIIVAAYLNHFYEFMDYLSGVSLYFSFLLLSFLLAHLFRVASFKPLFSFDCFLLPLQSTNTLHPQNSVVYD